MFELGTFDGFIRAASMSLLGFGTFVVLGLLSWIWSHVWAWIDESDISDGPLSLLIVRIFRLPVDPTSAHRSIKEYKGLEARYVQIVIFLLVAPIAIWLMLTFLNFTLIVATIVGLAYLTRFVRRLYKAFMKHVDNKNAHKE